MNAWIVLADASSARVFSGTGRKRSVLKLVRKMTNANGRSMDSDMGSDRPGRISSSAGHRGLPYRAAGSPKELEAKHFAGEVAKFLRAGNETEFSSLALVAPPHFLGMLRGELGTQLKKKVVAAVDKDLTQVTPRELPGHLVDVYAAIRTAELQG